METNRSTFITEKDIQKFFKNEDTLEKHFKKIIEKGKNVCCVCNHDLDYHIDENDFWRCHCLGSDGWQCECTLRKDRSENNISYYDLERRVKKQIEELSQID